jgi:hypothetical protein
VRKTSAFFTCSALLLAVGLGVVVGSAVMSLGFKPGPRAATLLKALTIGGMVAGFFGYLGMDLHRRLTRDGGRRSPKALTIPSTRRRRRFSSQFEAEKFFIDKVTSQAKKEGVPLSEAETYMLGWTATTDGFTPDKHLTEEFCRETTDEKYEKKVCALLRHAYKNDTAISPRMKKAYRRARKALGQGDYYIVNMVDDALGDEL